MKILLAADGSPSTPRAAEALAKFAEALSARPEVHILNVHAPIPYAGAAAAAGAETVERYHREECEKALAVAQEVLTARHVAHKSSWIVGNAASEITAYAAKHGFDLIVMGSHGHGLLHNLALGSVATDVIRAAPCPVTVVK